ncbi:MAG: hypothetical protein SF162_09490 [bacterium]|nr:hypothetical protein [bacterium]
MKRRFVLPLLVAALAILAVGTVYAASGASISFGSGNGPAYFINGVTDLVEDETNCDRVAMMMTDSTGALLDIDMFCIDTTTGSGSDDADYGTGSEFSEINAGPVTYSLFDVFAGDSASDENTLAFGAFLLANRTCIAEEFYFGDSVAQGSPRSVCSFGSSASGCRLTIPSGSVVGDAPFGAQVYWRPGDVSPGVVLNPGTYTVVGQDESETYYRIVLACQFVWVRKDTMQPSFQAPQNGEPLPTRIVG